MTSAGVCHSDLHVRDGHWKRPGPIVMGHEGAGIVEAVGPGLDPAVVGRPVALTWYAPCLRCRECQRGRQWLCSGSPSLRHAQARRDHAPLPRGRIARPRLSLHRHHEHPPGRAGQRRRPHARWRPARGGGADRLRRLHRRRGRGQDGRGRRPGPRSPSSGSVAWGSRASWAPSSPARAGSSPSTSAGTRSTSPDSWAPRTGCTRIRRIRRRSWTASGRRRVTAGPDFVFEAIGLPQTIAQAIGALPPGGTAVLVGLTRFGETASFEPFPFVDGGRRILGSNYGSAVAAVDFPRYAECLPRRAAAHRQADRPAPAARRSRGRVRPPPGRPGGAPDGDVRGLSPYAGGSGRSIGSTSGVPVMRRVLRPRVRNDHAQRTETTIRLANPMR